MYQANEDPVDRFTLTDRPAGATSRLKMGSVTPMLDGRGNEYPAGLRVQQVGLAVAKAVRDRIDKALEGGPIRLRTVTIADSGKAHFKAYLLSVMLAELYADPLPATVRPAKQIVSPKALRLLEDRANAAFCPPVGVLELPGITLTAGDLFDLMTLVNQEVFRDDTKF